MAKDKSPICVTLTIDREMHAMLSDWAKEDDRPMASVIRLILKKEVQLREQKSSKQQSQ